MERIKAIVMSTAFLAVLLGLFAANLIKPDTALSYSERRHLAQFPSATFDRVMDASFMKDFDSYAADQFLWRDEFRAVKSAFDGMVWRKLDTNGLFMVNEDVFKIEYPLREDKAISLTRKLNALREMYLQEMDVHFAIVPDKNYFLPDNGKYLLLDYGRMRDLMIEHLPDMQYIDLFSTLTLEDYFNTDGHWRQERLAPVMAALGEGLGIDMPFDAAAYTAQSYDKFYGAYYGQSARRLTPDTLVWLENEATRNTVVQALTADGIVKVPMYHLPGLDGMDAYDLYLHGAQPLIFLTNETAATNRELILFRDSYSSSLAPLLMEFYAKVTLVDLRYIQPSLLGDYIKFAEQDVLIMLSATIVNNSDIIR